MASKRHVLVSFGPRRKEIVLEPHSEGGKISDLEQLKIVLLRELFLDDSIKDLGGGSHAVSSDLLIYRFNPVFDEEVELSSTEILSHGEKGLNVKLRNLITITLPDDSQGIFLELLCIICVIINVFAVSTFLDSSPATSVVESEDNASSASNCANAGDTLNPTLQDSDIMQNILASQGYDEAKNKEGKLFSTIVLYITILTLQHNFRRCYSESCCEVESPHSDWCVST